MSGSQLLRLRVNERLEAAVEEIFGLVEKTITEYEEEAVRSKREIGHLKQQLEQLVVLKPAVILTRTDTQLLSGEWPRSLQQYEIEAKEIPVLEEAKIQEHPFPLRHVRLAAAQTAGQRAVKEETAERRLSPDMEVDTWNKAEVKREIDRLKQHIELPVVLKDEVTSDMQEIRPSQQPDCLVAVEEVKIHDAKQIREEQEEMSISPDVEADAFNVEEVRDPDSEPDECCEPLSSSEAETVNESGDDERTEMDRSSSPLQSRSAELEQPLRGDQSCRFCGEHFIKDSFLIKHVATSHKGHKAFRCLDCNKEFDQRHRMVTHTRVHTGERPFSCDFCGKAFTWKSNLLRHMKKHTGMKLSTNQNEALTCFLCNKKFKHKRYLFNHARVHTGEKPFSCDFCGKAFAWKSNLCVHVKRHTRVHNGRKR